jgi:hypothetical protein
MHGDTGSSVDNFNENFDDSQVNNIIQVKTVKNKQNSMRSKMTSQNGHSAEFLRGTPSILNKSTNKAYLVHKSGELRELKF